MFLLVQVEAASANAEQHDLVAFVHVVENFARADFLLYEHFELRVVGRARKRKVSGFFTRHAENRNLTGNELNARRVRGR